VAVVVASASDAFLHPFPRRAALLACVAGYLVVVTAGSFIVDRRPRLRGLLIAALLALGCAAVSISNGRTILILMPLVALVAIRYRRPALVALLVFLAAWLALAVGSSASSGRAVLQAVGDFLAAALFTVIFSRLVLRERLASGQLATARERNRIAREIHDGLGHYLTSANVQLEAARTTMADGVAAERLRRAQALLHQGLDELRQTVSLLRADGDQRPFSRAMDGLLDEARADGLTVALHVGGDVRPLGPALEFALYRAAQEALTNVRRHARAHRADVQFQYGDGLVELTIEDDGVGPPPNPGQGFGLSGLRERFAMLEGVVEIGVAPAGGMALRVRVPA